MLLQQEAPKFHAALIAPGLAYIYRNHEAFAVCQATEWMRKDSELLAIANSMAASLALQAAARIALDVLEHATGPDVSSAMQQLSAALAAAKGQRDPKAVSIPIDGEAMTLAAPRMPDGLQELLLDLLDSRGLHDTQKIRLREFVEGSD